MSESTQPGPGLTWAELDDLADYAAGLLSGAPAERIAGLIRTDERWAAAHAALAAAEPAVRSALRTAAETTPSLPDDVAARLDAALNDAGAAVYSRPTRPSRVEPGPAASRPPSRPRGTSATRGPGRSRRLVLNRVMVAVLVLGALGGVTAVAREFLSGVSGAVTASDNAAPEVFAEGDEGALPPSEAAPMLTPAQTPEKLADATLSASGIDYRLETLPQLATQPPTPLPALRAGAGFDAALTEFVEPDGLDRCLTAVGFVHPGPVVAVDFARFEGVPAVILVVEQGERSVVVAVGSECGDAGPDILASVEVP